MTATSQPVPIEENARATDPATRAAVRATTEVKIADREELIQNRLHDPEELRRLGARLRQHALDRLPYSLDQREPRVPAKAFGGLGGIHQVR